MGWAFKAWGNPTTKANIKLPLYLLKHIMRAYEGVVVELKAFLTTSALNESE
jgi:hypothetical protein